MPDFHAANNPGEKVQIKLDPDIVSFQKAPLPPKLSAKMKIGPWANPWAPLDEDFHEIEALVG